MKAVKILKKSWTIASNTVVILLILIGLAYTLLLKSAPDTLDRIFPYRCYTILTDSMVPTIPVGSLVISKSLQPDEDPALDSIITFQAKYYGEDIVLTHYLREIVAENGALRYRTQAEGVQEYDNYITTRDDLLGTYVFHIPYIGKLAQFITSPYGSLMFLVLLLIWLINRFVKYQAKRGTILENGIKLTEIQFDPSDPACQITGKAVNRTGRPLLKLTMEITLYNRNHEVAGIYDFDLLHETPLPLKAGGKTTWRFEYPQNTELAAYEMHSRDITLHYTDLIKKSKNRPPVKLPSKPPVE